MIDYAQVLHDAINRLQSSWGEILTNPAGPEIADDIQATVDEIEAGNGAAAVTAFIARWLPEEVAA